MELQTYLFGYNDYRLKLITEAKKMIRKSLSVIATAGIMFAIFLTGCAAESDKTTQTEVTSSTIEESIENTNKEIEEKK